MRWGKTWDASKSTARASRVRVRKVLLKGKWWERDCGPLVAYLGATELCNPIYQALLGALRKRFSS